MDVHFQCPVCVPMLYVHVSMMYGHASCPCCLSMLHVLAVCPRSIAVPHVHAAWAYCMNMLHEQVALSWTWTCKLVFFSTTGSKNHSLTVFGEFFSNIWFFPKLLFDSKYFAKFLKAKFSWNPGSQNFAKCRDLFPIGPVSTFYLFTLDRKIATILFQPCISCN